jgi:glyoxylase-like metal-dependent hydrolase (beta-lactamase superfamily II)
VTKRFGLTLCETGACRHPEHSTRRDRGLGFATYPMFAAVIERAGERIIVDPGYAPRIVEATNHFPELLYRVTAPMQAPAASAIAARLDAKGLRESVSTVIVTHFHADHIAGLRDFPRARIVASRAAFEDFARRRGFSAVRRGYLPALAPDDLAERMIFYEDLPRAALPAALAPFSDGVDVFGDAGLLLTQLPGHATGQIGAVFRGYDDRLRFLIADAAWSVTALRADQPPPWATQRFLGAPRAYAQTWQALRRVIARDPGIGVRPAHCAESAAEEGAELA